MYLNIICFFVDIPRQYLVYLGKSNISSQNSFTNFKFAIFVLDVNTFEIYINPIRIVLAILYYLRVPRKCLIILVLAKQF